MCSSQWFIRKLSMIDSVFPKAMHSKICTQLIFTKSFNWQMEREKEREREEESEKGKREGEQHLRNLPV